MTTATQAPVVVDRAQELHQQDLGIWKGYCLKFVRRCAGAPPLGHDAAWAWTQARVRHPGDPNPPAGAPVFWEGGSHGHGHVVVSLGDGSCMSSDYKRVGHVDQVVIADITAGWGLQYLGWTEDINGVTISEFEQIVVPPISVSAVATAFQLQAQAPGVRAIKLALQAEGLLTQFLKSDLVGQTTMAGYAAWQRRIGFSGPDADGVPGPKSLAVLGRRHGFTVTA
jgi:hypothetical protein